ncbi:sulfatase modifying factor 2 [Mesorhizobium sp. L-8-10]|uniref:formylglycine-generating enzyme family protein n=1 Tax=Mesorhizobium sp. L-8-10 TaxID=2744523 RepID=UPI0019387C8E|nr:SUMF1/EgtB/PvdO family nonheme iron enzyme [Mesorhizobium sp. L-8-10]BCH34270.1 sulfatase modifying factor 2 [Mesorhizobium sp. L-8-10]
MSISELQASVLAIVLLAASGARAGDDPIPGNPLILIAAGPFIFGNEDGREDERPRRLVDGQAFVINRTEITNRQYRDFVEATGHRPAFYANHPVLGLDDHPVVGVSWDDADAFCRHYGLVLPSEREYERAARGAGGDAFPWGSTPSDTGKSNAGAAECCAGDDADGYEMSAPADSFVEGASREGVLNLVGNVWEWTRDFYAPYLGEPDPAISGRFKVLRGGSWNSDPSRLTTTARLVYNPDFRFAANGGFRCVRSGSSS